MSFTLPKEINYSSLPSLPAGSQCIPQSLLPINASTFAVQSGTLIQFDLPATGYLIPDSMYLRYKYAVDGAGISAIRSTPATAPFQRFETIFGSQTVESINNFNQIQNMLINSSMGVSEKYGSSLGYRSTVSASPGNEYFDGKILNINEIGSMSFPIRNTLLTSANKLVPLGFMPSVRVQFTLDNISNVFAGATTAIVASSENGILAQPALTIPNGFTLSNVQLCYRTVQFGQEVDEMVRSMGEKIFIKSSSFTNAGSNLATGSIGTLEIVYNQRLASIKSLFLHSSSSSFNGIFDSFNLSPLSEYSFNIGGRVFPPRPITSENALLELKQAIGSLLDKTNQSSINPLEFSRTLGTDSSLIAPAKFYVGCNTEVLSRYKNMDSSVLLSGISTQSSPISVRINIPTSTSSVCTLNLICHYDAILEIDVASKSAYVRQ